MSSRHRLDQFPVRAGASHSGYTSGTTLVEVLVSLAILGSFLVSIDTLTWRSLAYLKAAIDGAAGSRVLSSLAEQVRTRPWAQVVDGTSLATVVLPNCVPSTNLNNVSETIDVNPYPSGTPAQTLEVVRAPDGGVTITKGSDGSLPNQQTVRVDLTLQWSTTFNSRVHTRMLSLIVSKYGALGRNL